jgi:hypothetical protein
MNISADGILGTAQKINQKRVSSQSNITAPQVQGKTDTVQIQTQLSGRLNTLQQELRTAQDSLSQNQAIREGLNLLMQDVQAGGSNVERILAEVRYNNRPILSDFLNNQEVTQEFLQSRIKDNSELIRENMNALSRLQIESENIFASNLVPDTNTVSRNLSGADADSLSKLNAETVMRLTKQ